ncbi:MAG: thiamine/thiamine pyrophosphate ABC transporter permease [Mesorhizobium sp.]
MFAGRLSLAFLALLVGGAFAGLAVEAARDWSGAAAAFDGYMLRVAWFTFWQAALSALLSVIPAMFVARALSRQREFPGRGLILRLFAVPLGLPAIVAALGILALYGRAGIVADAVDAMGGGQWPSIYGLSGILVAHVFFNLPLATRLLLEALETVPQDQWRLAAQLGMKPASVFRLIEWPAMRRSLPGVAALVFMLCVTSFTLVLTLGGGPAATTLEVAIYQSLRFDFEPARAVALTLAQIAMTIAAVLLMARLGASTTGDANLPVASRRFSDNSVTERLANTVIIAIAAIFVAGPIIAVFVSGVEADIARLVTERPVLRAASLSLSLALCSALIAVAMSLSLAAMRSRLARARRGKSSGFGEWMADQGPSLILVLPPIVIGAGWFVLVRGTVDVAALAPVMVITVNAAMAMPFAMRAIRPAWDNAALRNDRLCAQLGISGFNRWQLIDWPAMRRPIAMALAFAMALSLGDLGVIALFGSESVQTLPYLLYLRLGAYRTADAAGIALLLGLMCFVLMAISDWLGRRS